MAGIIASIIAPHTPRMGMEDTAPAFVQPLIEGSRMLGQWLRELAPDCIVLQSTHWVSTFNWYATAHAEHAGYCVAEEAPELIPGLPYRYRGDPELARALAASATAAGVPFRLNDCAHYHWDYGCYVPLKYLDPDASLPVVTLPTVILSDLDECLQVGRLVDAAARASGRRVAFIASTALTHALVRGPEAWPTAERQALDLRLLDMLERGAVGEAIDWLPEYAQQAVGEMGGRVVAGFLGALDAMAGQGFGSRRFSAYAQSSGSGNLCFACSPALAA